MEDVSESLNARERRPDDSTVFAISIRAGSEVIHNLSANVARTICQCLEGNRRADCRLLLTLC